jgi:two-component system chemotaxis response regulator CheY
MIPNLLVTDDDTAFRNVVCDAFSRRGFRVLDARDGQEALDALACSEIHLALLDIHMPRLNGLEVMRRLSLHPGHPPMVLMSAAWDEVSRLEAERMKAYRTLEKPIRLDQLREVVCGALAEVYGWRPPSAGRC